MEWFLIAYMVFKTRKAFNLANILSFNISYHVWEAISMKIHVFYMKTYHIYVVCVEHVFPSFNWTWDSIKSLIHEYFSWFWEENYKDNIYDI